MKVLLTGATGFLGSEIARQLTAAGHEVRITVRKSSKLEAIAGLPLERIEADVNDRAAIARALEGVDALVHTAASVSARVRDRESIWKANVEGTRTVLDAALAAKVKRVVYTSSVAAVGVSEAPALLDERTAWNSGPLDYGYVTAKKAAEDLALSYAGRGLSIVVLNPGLILGPGDVYGSSVKVLSEWLSGKLAVYLEGGMTICDVRDVAAAHVAALEKGGSGERYIVAGQNHTWTELYETASRLSGVRPPLRIPYAIAYAAAALSELVSRFAEHPLEDLNRPVVRFARRYNYCDVKKAGAALGYRPRALEETVRDTLADLVARGKSAARTEALKSLAASARPAAKVEAKPAPEPALAGAGA